MSISELQEAQAQTVQAFKSNVEDLALEELSRLEIDREDLQARLALVTDSIKQVKSVLQATRPKDAPAPRKRNPDRGTMIGPDAKAEVLAWVKGMNGDEITAAKLRAQFPNRSGSFANIALKQLRDEGLIRLAGKSGATYLYRAL